MYQVKLTSGIYPNGSPREAIKNVRIDQTPPTVTAPVRRIVSATEHQMIFNIKTR